MPIRVGGCLSLRWPIWKDKGADSWVVEVLRWGYQISFSFPPPLSPDPIPFVSYSLSSIKGKALIGEVRSLIDKGAIKLAPPSPGFLQLFVRCLEDVGFMASGDRPLPPERVCASDSVQDGD